MPNRKAEVHVSKDDKENLMMHLEAVCAILDKYPYSMDHSIYFVTSMSRAKSAAAEARKWCGYLDVKEE